MPSHATTHGSTLWDYRQGIAGKRRIVYSYLRAVIILFKTNQAVAAHARAKSRELALSDSYCALQ